MYFKIFLNAILVLSLVAFQVSFVSSLPSYFSNINILLLILVYVLIISDMETAFIYALSFGILMDMFSFMPFGVYSLSFILLSIVTNFLLINFFTNRSIYAFLALTASASILNFLFIVIFNNLSALVVDVNQITLRQEFFSAAMQQLLLNLAFMILIFYSTNFLNNSLRPVFLMNKKK